MRSEAEIKAFLVACDKVAGFGMSNGPCPVEEVRCKECPEMYEPDEFSTKEDLLRGCCAECSFPGALDWVLGSNRHVGNGQDRLTDWFCGKE